MSERVFKSRVLRSSFLVLNVCYNFSSWINLDCDTVSVAQVLISISTHVDICSSGDAFYVQISEQCLINSFMSNIFHVYLR